MRVLVIAPHMDDETLGLGGTIRRHVVFGDRVRVLFVANRVYDHKLDQEKLEREEAHALAAKEVLGYQEMRFGRLSDECLDQEFTDVVDLLEEEVSCFKPDHVYLNHHGDPHQDHTTVFKASQIALRTLSDSHEICRVLCYEVPSSTEQAFPVSSQQFSPNIYVDIESYLTVKQSAMDCYETERRPYPHPRSARGIELRARMRGVEVGLAAAEAFVLVRELVI